MAQEEKGGQKRGAERAKMMVMKEPDYLGSWVSGENKPRQAPAFLVQWKPWEGFGEGVPGSDVGYTEVSVAVPGEWGGR